MIDILLTTLSACAKMFSVATALNLPVDHIRSFALSSEPMLLVFMFLFVAGETKTILPALLVTIAYVYLEVTPSKRFLGIQHELVENI